MAKVLITGSEGYIASNLAPYLAERNWTVVGYDVLNGDNILDIHNLLNHMKGCELVYHCAAVSGVKACDLKKDHAYAVNFLGTNYVVAAAKACGAKPILFSSFAVFGDTTYGHTKSLCEKKHKKQAVILRLSNVFGGINYWKKHNVIHHFFKDDPIIVYEGGKQTRDLVPIDTVLEWCEKAINLNFGIHDVCSGYKMPILHLGKIFAAARNVNIVIDPNKM